MKNKIKFQHNYFLSDRMDKFFERLVEDLETYAVHAKRKTIEVEDAELLLRRYVFFLSCCMTTFLSFIFNIK